MSLREYSSSRRGFVLVSVLMLGVVLISCATAITWFVRTQARSTGGERFALTSRSMAEILAMSVAGLLGELANLTAYDSPVQKWYQPFDFTDDELGVWVVQVTPLDDKIPLRHLFLPDGSTLRREISAVWEDLWEKLGHRELAPIVLDFLDRNTRPLVGGTERDGFLNRPPYDMSELLILSTDITPSILAGLDEYCTIYSDGRINLNTAPVKVMELLPGLDTGGMAERVAQSRVEKPLESLTDVQSLPGAGPKASSQLTNIVTFSSRYFLLKIDSIDADGAGGISYRIILDRTTKQIVRWEET